MCYFYCHQSIGEKIGPSPILSVIHTVTIGTMLNFNGGNNEDRLKNGRCKLTLMAYMVRYYTTEPHRKPNAFRSSTEKLKRQHCTCLNGNFSV